MKKIGRNQLCPCGSGKKFKKCCLMRQSSPKERLWQQCKRLDQTLIRRMMEFIQEKTETPLVRFALDEFLNWPDTPVAEIPEDLVPVFVPWLLYNRELHPKDVSRLPESSGATIVETFLPHAKESLSDLEYRYLKTANRAPFSFYQVDRCKPKSGFVLKDLMTQTTFDVREEMISAQARKGDILFARVISFDQIHMISGCTGFLIPEESLPVIAGLRMRIASDGSVTKERLMARESDILDCYRNIRNDLFHPHEIRKEEQSHPASVLPPAAPEPAPDPACSVASHPHIARHLEAFHAAHEDAELKTAAAKLFFLANTSCDVRLDRGKDTIWAASILYAAARHIGRMGSSKKQGINASCICDFFDTKKSTVQSKALQLERQVGYR